MLERIARWIWWATIARVIDFLCVVLTALFLPIWYFYFRPKGWNGERKPVVPNITVEELIARGPKDPVRDGYFSDVEDYHGLMCQVGHGYFANTEEACKMFCRSITKEDSLHRYVPNGLKPSDSPPSVDMLAAFCYFYS